MGGSYNLPILGPNVLLFVAQGKVGQVPVPAILFLGLAVVFLFIERRSTFGRHVYAIGANPIAARIFGLPVSRVRLLTYIISGAGAGFAGYLAAIQVEAAASYYGQNEELAVITAILIGGTSMYGGDGSVARSVLGAIVVGEISDGLGVMNVNQNWQVVAMGALFIVAVSVSLAWRKTLNPGWYAVGPHGRGTYTAATGCRARWSRETSRMNDGRLKPRVLLQGVDEEVELLLDGLLAHSAAVTHVDDRSSTETCSRFSRRNCRVLQSCVELHDGVPVCPVNPVPVT